MTLSDTADRPCSERCKVYLYRDGGDVEAIAHLMQSVLDMVLEGMGQEQRPVRIEARPVSDHEWDWLKSEHNTSEAS